MNILTVILKSGQEYQYSFNDRARAQKFKDDYIRRTMGAGSPGAKLDILDEFQKDGSWDASSIAGVQITSVDKKLDLEIKLALLQAHAEVKMKNTFSTDPVLRGLQGLVSPIK